MNLDFACGYRKPKSRADRELDCAMHEAIISGDMRRYLCAHTNVYHLDPPRPRRRPRRHCPCGAPIYDRNFQYCLEHRALTANELRILFAPRPTAKLTPAQVRNIRRELECGARRYALAERYGISYMQIWKIGKGRAWKSVK